MPTDPGGAQPPITAKMEAATGPQPKRLTPKLLSAAAGWTVGVVVGLAGALAAFGSAGYPPSVVQGCFMLAAGALVLPPVTAAARRIAPFMRPYWMPPAMFVLLLLAMNAGSAVEPHGAARLPYINRAIAAADADIKAHQGFDASGKLFPFAGDAATNPAVKAALARVATEQAAEAVTAGATGGSPQVGTKGSVQSDFDRVNPAFLGAVFPCQMGFAATQKAIHAGDRYRAYDAAQSAKQACVTAWESADAAKYSDATPQPFRDKLNADLKDCGEAYAQDGAALDSIATVLNGDARPSAVSTATRDIAIASARVTSCLTTYNTDALAAGIKLPGLNGGRSKHKRPHPAS